MEILLPMLEVWLKILLWRSGVLLSETKKMFLFYKKKKETDILFYEIHLLGSLLITLLQLSKIPHLERAER